MRRYTLPQRIVNSLWEPLKLFAFPQYSPKPPRYVYYDIVVAGNEYKDSTPRFVLNQHTAGKDVYFRFCNRAHSICWLAEKLSDKEFILCEDGMQFPTSIDFFFPSLSDLYIDLEKRVDDLKCELDKAASGQTSLEDFSENKQRLVDLKEQRKAIALLWKHFKRDFPNENA